jgi:hypothetical protein
METIQKNAYPVQRNLLRILAVTSASWGLLPRSRNTEPLAYRAALRTLTEPAANAPSYLRPPIRRNGLQSSRSAAAGYE